MLIDREAAPIARRAYDLSPDALTLAQSDARGVPLAGRSTEIAALRETGARNASLGRIFEGHLNGAQLVARCGDDAQRAALRDAIATGHIFGVWNTQERHDGLRIQRHGDTALLSGAKTWASGAGSITRPLVTAAWPDGSIQLVMVPIDEHAVQIDTTGWQPLGMHASDSFRVCFDGVRLRADALIGAPGDYERQPWFFAGALRFAAVQTGIIERLFNETVSYLAKLGRTGDTFQCARVADMKIQLRTSLAWLDLGTAAWMRFDADPSAHHAAEVLDVVDMARTVVERAGVAVSENAIRSVGAHGLVEPEPFASLVRDLQMYLRQPAPDAALLRVGRAAFSPMSEISSHPAFRAR
jgi:alkylation response protein AidB-like acyl-CoA dehydrogenase